MENVLRRIRRVKFGQLAISLAVLVGRFEAPRLERDLT